MRGDVWHATNLETVGFEGFSVTRLKVTARISVAVVGVIALTGCAQVPDNAMRNGPNGVEIQINDGRNCWDNQCIRYDARKNEIEIPGRAPVMVPADVDLSDGYVSEADFAAMLLAARRAPLMTEAEDEAVGGSGGGRV